MPTPAEDAFGEQWAGVRQSFIRSFEPRIARLRELLAASASEIPGARDEIEAIAHKLAGSCASFGFDDIGRAAMTLEDKLIDAKVEPIAVWTHDVEELIHLCQLAAI